MEHEKLETIVNGYIDAISQEYNLKVNSFYFKLGNQHVMYPYLIVYIKINYKPLELKLDKYLYHNIKERRIELNRINYALRRFIKEMREEQLVLELAGVK